MSEKGPTKTTEKETEQKVVYNGENNFKKERSSPNHFIADTMHCKYDFGII